MKRRESMKFVTCPGSRVHPHYESHFDGKGIVLVESGVTDIQEEIESYGKYTDLHYMLHRLSVGDRNVLSKRTPIYGDFSGMPTNPIDAINVVQSAESRFAELSLEERSAYNNDFRAWLAAVLSGETARPGAVLSGDVDNPELKEETKE